MVEGLMSWSTDMNLYAYPLIMYNKIINFYNNYLKIYINHKFMIKLQYKIILYYNYFIL